MADEPNVPKARLGQIAARRLSALGVTHKLVPESGTVEGELALVPPITHPVSGDLIPRAGFVVIGHDRLGLTDPPLSGLDPIAFYDAESLGVLSQRVNAALKARMSCLKDVGERFSTFRLEPTLDVERLLLQAALRVDEHDFDLLGGPDGIRVTRVTPSSGKAFEVGRAEGLLSPQSLTTPAELEAYLRSAAESWQAHAVRPSLTPPPAPPQTAPVVKLISASPKLLTTEALACFGEEAVVTYGNALEVNQEVEIFGERYRFVAVHERGTTFKGRLFGPTGDKWAERFDCLQFQGVVALANTVFNLEPSSDVDDLEIDPDEGPPAPLAGEIWVMDVLVEEEAEDEVRYTGTDVNGRPYGAPRVLKRADFESVFTQTGGGWRLRIRLDSVEGSSVSYHQIDAQGQPRGASRNMAAAILASTFAPEDGTH